MRAFWACLGSVYCVIGVPRGAVARTGCRRMEDESYAEGISCNLKMALTVGLLAQSLKEIQVSVESLQKLEYAVNEMAMDIVKATVEGSKVLTIGNGGSYAQADHLCCELVGRFEKDRDGLSAICLSSMSSYTAIANDFGHRLAFARQIHALGRRDDILVAFSTSGRSKNIQTALQVAIDKEMKVYLLTGSNVPTDLPQGVKILSVNAVRTCRIQELHMVLIHLTCELVDSQTKKSTLLST